VAFSKVPKVYPHEHGFYIWSYENYDVHFVEEGFRDILIAHWGDLGKSRKYN
jgi:hypothetical protein